MTKLVPSTHDVMSHSLTKAYLHGGVTTTTTIYAAGLATTYLVTEGLSCLVQHPVRAVHGHVKAALIHLTVQTEILKHSTHHVSLISV